MTLAATLLRPAPGDRVWPRRDDLLFGGQALILLAAALATHLTGTATLPEQAPALLLAAVAMGIQSAVVRTIAPSGLGTTYITGTLTAGVFRLLGRVRGSAVRARAAADFPDRWLPFLLWGAYLVGAFGGGWVAHRLGASAGYLTAALVLGAVDAAAYGTRLTSRSGTKTTRAG